MNQSVYDRELVTRGGRLSRSDLVVLGLAVLIILVSLAQVVYRLSLPSEGWSFARDTTGTNRLLVFDRDLAGRPQDYPSRSRSIRSGDILINIASRQVDTALLDALTFRAERPAEWVVGETLYYTVIREDSILQVDVQLIRLGFREVLLNLGRNWLMSPGPLLTVLIAFFVFFRHPKSQPARLLLLFSATVFASDGISQGVMGTNVIGPTELFDPWAFWLAQIMNAFIWPFLTAPLYLHLFLSFLVPRSGTISRYPRVTLVVLYGLMPFLTLLLWIFSGGKPLVFWHRWSALSFADFVIILLLAIGAMIYTLLTLKDVSQRAQVEWVAWGILITSIGALAGNLFVASGLKGDTLLAAWVLTRLIELAFPISVAIAILRYRLFDIDIVIRGTLVYAVLTTLFGTIYLVNVILFQFLFRQLTGANSPLAVVGSTLIIAGLFFPLRKRVQDLIDRRMYRRKYDAERTIQAFSAAVRDEVDLEQLSNHLIRVVEDTMQPITVSLWMRPGSRSRRGIRYEPGDSEFG